MNQTQAVLLYSLGSVLFGVGCERISAENILLEAERHGIEGLMLPSYDYKTLSIFDCSMPRHLKSRHFRYNFCEAKRICITV